MTRVGWSGGTGAREEVRRVASRELASEERSTEEERIVDLAQGRGTQAPLDLDD